MKPRFVRLFVVMLALVAAFLWLGKWQWSVAHSTKNDDTLRAASQRGRVPLERAVKPQTEFDNTQSLQPVTASGTYDAAKTELVAQRVLGRQHGWWVMTPIVVDGTGARLPIVRGFVTSTAGIPAPPSGHVTVEGAIAPGESVSTVGELPAGQIGAIDMGLLLNQWGGRVYNAFVFATKQTPATEMKPGEATLTPIPPPVPEHSTIEWRNAAYALQWWIFAAFAVFMWVKLVREDHRESAEGTQAVALPVSPTAHDDDGPTATMADEQSVDPREDRRNPTTGETTP